MTPPTVARLHAVWSPKRGSTESCMPQAEPPWRGEAVMRHGPASERDDDLDRISIDGDDGPDDSHGDSSDTDSYAASLEPGCHFSTPMYWKNSTRSSCPTRSLRPSHSHEPDHGEAPASREPEEILARQREEPFREPSPTCPELHLRDACLSSFDDPPTDLDYGLIEVTRAAHKAPNSIRSPSSSLEQESMCIERISTDGPKDARVLGIVPRGTIAGSLSGTSMYTRLPHATEFQEVYHVLLDGPVQDGDCGSWVIDAESGDLFGHVVAGSPGAGAAMVMPAASVFRDIARRAHVRPRLPEAESESSAGRRSSAKRKHSAPAATRKETQPESGRMEQTQGYGGWMGQLRVRFEAMLRSRRMETLRDLRKRAPPGDPPDSRQAQRSWQVGRLLRNLPLVPQPPAPTDRDAQKFQNLLISLSLTPLKYEVPALVDEAAQLLPLDSLFREAEQEEQRHAGSVDGRRPEWGQGDLLIQGSPEMVQETLLHLGQQSALPLMLVGDGAQRNDVFHARGERLRGPESRGLPVFDLRRP